MSTTPTAERMIIHRNGCTGTAPTQRRLGRLGDTLEQCTKCRAFYVLPRTEAAPAPVELTPPPAPVEAEAPRRRPARGLNYRCREHDHPVCWRGRGCRRCTADKEAARIARKRGSKPAPERESPWLN